MHTDKTCESFATPGIRIELKRTRAALHESRHPSSNVVGNTAAGGTQAATPKPTLKKGAGRHSPVDSPHARGVTNTRTGASHGGQHACSPSRASPASAEEPKRTGACSVVKVLMARWTHPRG